MPRGNAKWFDVKKAYGFIIGEAGQDVFVHYTSIVGEGFRSLRDGEPVDYELVQSDKGLQARNVRRLAASDDSPKSVVPAQVRPSPGAAATLPGPPPPPSPGGRDDP
jgi:cold shock protein